MTFGEFKEFINNQVDIPDHVHLHVVSIQTDDIAAYYETEDNAMIISDMDIEGIKYLNDTLDSIDRIRNARISLNGPIDSMSIYPPVKRFIRLPTVGKADA